MNWEKYLSNICLAQNYYPEYITEHLQFSDKKKQPIKQMGKRPGEKNHFTIEDIQTANKHM